MNTRLSLWCLGLCWLVLGLLPMHVARAQSGALVAVPPLDARVTDLTGTLTPDQRSALESKLAAFESERGTQIAILIIATTQPETIEQYGYRVASTWKIGRKEVGDGVLVLVARQDRSLRIEVAKALEGAVPDLAAHRIIDQAITPAFKMGDFAGGLNLGVDQLMARIKGENLPLPEHVQSLRNQLPDFDFFHLLGLAFVGIPILSGILSALLGRKLGALATGGLCGFVAWLALSHLLVSLTVGVIACVLALARMDTWGRSHGGGWSGGRGGWSSGGGGGGWSSGGGGDFGGGGASGKW